jgi:hypothetical protein
MRRGAVPREPAAFCLREDVMRLMDQSSQWGILGAALVSVAGCVGAEGGLDEGANGSEPTAQAKEAVGFDDATEFVWRATEQEQNGNTVIMEHWSTHICVLSGIKGDLAGDGEHVWVNFFPPNGFWTLSGISGKNNVEARALCVPRSSFSMPSGVSLANTDLVQTRVRSAKKKPWPLAQGPVYAEHDVEVGGDSDVGLLAGIGGRVDDSDCEVRIDQGNASRETLLHVSNGIPFKERTYGDAFALRRSDGRLPWAAKINDRVRYDASPTYGVAAGQVKSMVATGRGICFLTDIQGKFDGAGDSVRIYPAEVTSSFWVWFLEAKGSSTISAAARCIDYDQLNR